MAFGAFAGCSLSWLQPEDYNVQTQTFPGYTNFMRALRTLEALDYQAVETELRISWGVTGLDLDGPGQLQSGLGELQTVVWDETWAPGEEAAQRALLTLCHELSPSPSATHPTGCSWS